MNPQSNDSNYYLELTKTAFYVFVTSSIHRLDTVELGRL